MDNKFPGKDIINGDLETKFPLAAKKIMKAEENLRLVELSLGGIKYPYLLVRIWLSQKN